MAQKYKVFIDSGRIHFVESFNNEGNSTFIFHKDYETFIQAEDISNLNSDVVIFCENAKLDFRRFKAGFTFIKASGGIVKSKDKFLFIFRNGKWDLPKGKMEEGEKPKQTAIREIAEECSLSGHMIVDKICNTYHTYPMNGEQVLKKTSWFYLELENRDAHNEKPQLEEGITDLRWFAWNDLDQVRANTYDSILDVLNQFEKLLSFEEFG